MQSGFEIELKALKIHANHGVFEQERFVGNDFVVNLKVVTSDNVSVYQDCLDNTVSYADLYEVVVESMKLPRMLLESVAKEIATIIMERWDSVREIFVSIEKQVPPIAGIDGSASVKYFLKK